MSVVFASTDFLSVMAMTRYNVEHWDSPDNDDIRHTLSAASMWLICTKSVLINHTPPLMPSELEIWIHNATRSLLSSLIEKISTFRPCPQAFPQDYLIVNVVEPLTVACKDIWEGYHLVPEKFLSVAHQILGSDERWRGSSLRRHLKHLESAIEWGRCQSGSANQWQRCDAEQDSTRCVVGQYFVTSLAQTTVLSAIVFPTHRAWCSDTLVINIYISSLPTCRRPLIRSLDGDIHT